MKITLGGIELGEVNRTVCPICRQTYYEIQLLSDIGIEQQICPDCEFRKTLTAAGISQMKQEEALRLIYEYIAAECRQQARG